MNINRRVTALVLAPALMMLGLVAFAPPASAHEAVFEATCDGVRIHTTRDYEPQQHNRWTVTVGGEVHSGTFGASLDKTFPVPQDGASTDWSASIDVDESDQYDRSTSPETWPGQPCAACRTCW